MFEVLKVQIEAYLRLDLTSQTIGSVRSLLKAVDQISLSKL